MGATYDIFYPMDPAIWMPIIAFGRVRLVVFVKWNAISINWLFSPHENFFNLNQLISKSNAAFKPISLHVNCLLSKDFSAAERKKVKLKSNKAHIVFKAVRTKLLQRGMKLLHCNNHIWMISLFILRVSKVLSKKHIGLDNEIHKE